MAKAKIKVEWRNQAVIHFKKILEYLAAESDIAVSIVGNAIVDEINLLSKHPTAHPLDRFKKNNNGKFRAFIVYSYRISYFVDNKIVYVLRIRHTSREPLEH
jgi:plasmid stabilization system protein ParE